MDWIKYYTYVSKLFEAGYSKVLWRFNSIFQILLVLNTFLILKGYDFGIVEYIFMAIALVTIIFSVGFVYLRLGLFKADQKAIYSENQIILGMQKDIWEIKELLKQKK